jgi:pseudoazurin
MRTLLTAFVVAAATLLGAAFAQEGEVVTIEMITEGGQFYYDPIGVQVEPGTTIRFVNASGSHNAVSYSEDNGKPQRIPSGAEGWSSPIGQDFEVTLTAEGVYDYYCQPHEALGMVGRIVVGDPAAYPARDPGELQFDAAANGLPSVDAILAQEDGVLDHGEFAQD